MQKKGLFRILLPPSPHVHQGFYALELMVVVAIIGILAAIAVPQYIKYVKRARTSEALEHIRQIYMAMADWHSNPDLGNGTFMVTTSDMDKVAGGTKTFAEHFPAESSWVDLGDKNYLPYSAQSTLGVGGGMVPLVLATARNTDAVFGITVRTLSGGEATITAISPTY